MHVIVRVLLVRQNARAMLFFALFFFFFFFFSLSAISQDHLRIVSAPRRSRRIRNTREMFRCARAHRDRNEKSFGITMKRDSRWIGIHYLLSLSLFLSFSLPIESRIAHASRACNEEITFTVCQFLFGKMMKGLTKEQKGSRKRIRV